MRTSSRLAVLGLIVLAIVGGLVSAFAANAAVASSPSSAPTASSSSRGTPPPGFTSRFARVDGVNLHYVIGGQGRPLVLLHGWPQDWSEFREQMPTLAKSHTVIAVDLPGAGRSSIPRSGYDGATVARRLHGLLEKLKLTEGVDLVAHDIGIWVAYPYAALYREDLRRIAVMDATIPDQSLFKPAALNPTGPSVWHHGFFQEEPLAEQLIAGHEGALVKGFIQQFLVVRSAFSASDYRYFTDLLRRPGRVHAWLSYYRALRSADVAQNAAFLAQGKLTMPVLAIGAASGVGQTVPDQWNEYATQVTPQVLPETGHWITEERPRELTALLDQFFQ